MTQLNFENTKASGVTFDLEDEEQLTKQCLRVCEDAKSFIETLSERESSLLPELSHDTVEDSLFEAQLRMRQALEKNRESFEETIDHLRRRLNSMLRDNTTGKDDERSELQADIEASKQCLDLCKVANEVSRQTVYRIGEAIAEDDSDQVVVTTLAELFDIKKVLSKNNSAQLVGSMTSEDLQLLTEKRYGSRFCTVASRSPEVGTTRMRADFVAKNTKHAAASQPRIDEQSPTVTRSAKQLPNEMRKRHMDGCQG
jgi:hypothetical protein